MDHVFYFLVGVGICGSVILCYLAYRTHKQTLTLFERMDKVLKELKEQEKNRKEAEKN